MNTAMPGLYVMFRTLREEQGQDLIEYVLIGGIVALGATAGMNSLATSANEAFSTLGSSLLTYI